MSSETKPESHDAGMRLPKNYDHAAHDPKWQRFWEEHGIYRYDREDTKKPVYSIDTPPPYVSGEFHMGNALNWAYFDFVARYKRMRGFNVHFPQGWDCHGLPTEVRAEKTYNIRKNDVPVEKFREICVQLTVDYIERMKAAMLAMGYSMDWSLEYRTMDPNYYKATQLSFVQLYKKNYLYRAEHPVNWCPRCETAIAEAEVEYVEDTGQLYNVKFTGGKQDLIIATTRPELIPACVAVAFNPADERYLGLAGGKARLPLFNREVPILSAQEVDRDFGTGLVMICTFGDKTDVLWQKRNKLPVIMAIDSKGIMTKEAGQYEGLPVMKARTAIAEDLRAAGLLVGVKGTQRNVGTCWRCATTVEIISALQWFMRTKDLTDDVIKWADSVNWVPVFAKKRLIDWATSLDWDWVFSRQRIFATPIPVWYCKRCQNVLVAEENWLPVDPRSEAPKIGKCPKCESSEFNGENDVMDTWMDSSLTCAFNAGWPDDLSSFERRFPADLQPNGYDIIRTWDYYLMVKHLAMFGRAPYKTALINGMVRGSDGRMMHKSYGNFVESSEAINKYGADSLRQWAAAGGSTGYDVPFKWGDVEYGRKFLTKLWNASRLVLSHLLDYEIGTPASGLHLLDRWLLSRLEHVNETVTNAFDNYQFNIALDTVRNFTWHEFCDQYLEAVKYRLYDKDPRNAGSRRAVQYTLFATLDRIIRFLAPICPHLTESISEELWGGKAPWKSIHQAAWPERQTSLIDEGLEKKGAAIIAITAELRRLKAEKHVTLKTPIQMLRIHAPLDLIQTIQENSETIRNIAIVKNLVTDYADAPEGAKPVSEFPEIKLVADF